MLDDPWPQPLVVNESRAMLPHGSNRPPACRLAMAHLRAFTLAPAFPRIQAVFRRSKVVRMRSKLKSSERAERLRRGPDRGAALAQYEGRAATYDLELAVFEPIRELAIERLELRPGETVL